VVPGTGSVNRRKERPPDSQRAVYVRYFGLGLCDSVQQKNERLKAGFW
jgi:hypothetical protein